MVQDGAITEEEAQEIALGVHELRGGKTISEHAGIACDKLADDDIVAFGLVAIREDEDGYQEATHRAVDVEAVMDAADPEAFIDELHNAMVSIFNDKVAEK